MANDKMVNAWLFLNEDEPKVNGKPVAYSNPLSCFQTLISNNVYQSVDVLFLCFLTTVIPEGSQYATIEIGQGSHPDNKTNADYMAMINADSRANNPDIKVCVTMGYNGGTYSRIFQNSGKPNPNNPGSNITDTDCASAFAVGVVEYLKANNLDGLDLDWESPVDSELTTDRVGLLISEIRAAMNASGDNYLFTVSPASPGTLDGDAVNKHIDFLNLQLYSGFTFPSDYTSAPYNIEQSLLAYGAKFENNGQGTNGDPTYWAGYQTAQNAYDGYQSGGYKIATQWRLNSENFGTEQNSQVELYKLIKG
ncbi:glycoside hydrolase family 18 protein [Roseivirga sp. E12]|uniref:glycoside hydrolase family 18 protein n=1 Tax=Roseivirga sp. E12 TaxID=2819237 RepID=UPI001ABC1D1B|nr:glycoside hydrolase family 18 protein [Roseivirga sp. E12]MBO3696805.1 glycoside hydrolase family 18 protein [Roseivirga sp. E12]